MPDLKGGTPRDSMLVAELGGERYLVAQESLAAQVGGGARSWATERIALQEDTPEGKEFSIPIGDFSQGAGYTFADRPGVYDWSDGWDCSAPNKPGTWPRLATGQAFTTVDYRGWILPLSTYVYIMRGRYCCKYAIDDTAGATWPIVEIHDFGSGNVVTGRPAEFLGKMYVPLRAGAGGALAVFHELTTVVASVVESQTIAISGTPTAGTYTVTFDGKTTAAIAYNADAATVQAALRLIAGMELVTVSSAGSVPNYTHTVVMTGVGGSLGAASPPQMTSTDSTTGGTHAIAHATTVAGTADTWTAGPAGKEMSAFIVNKNLLFGANGNTILSCATAPTTAGNWSATSEVGQGGQAITDFFNFDRFLGVNKTDGPWTFDETKQTTQELPDLGRVIDNSNGIGAEYSNGHVLIPHKAGLIRWRPQNYEFIGPEQEGAQEQARSVHGFGRIASLAAYGKQVFFCTGEDGDAKGAIGSFLPPTGAEGGRGPLIPHIHHVNERAYEAVAVVTSSTQPASPQIPATITDDSAVGTITWSNPSNAGASDGSYATAAVGTSHYLKGLAPPVNVPTAATITGVLATIERSAVAATSPAFRAVASGGGNTGSGFSVTKPAGTTDGDVLVVAIQDDGGVNWSDVPAPTGWTRIIADAGSSFDGRMHVFWKVAASEGASWTFTPTATGGSNYRYAALAYSGGTTVEASASGVGGSSTTSHTVNPPSAITPNTTFVALLGSNQSATTFTPPAGMTERHDAGAAPEIMVADKSLSATGDPGDQIFTSSEAIATIYGALIISGAAVVADNIVKLVKGGSVVGTSQAVGTAWGTTDATISYGGAASLWGTTLTAAEVNAADFGIVLSATVTSGLARVDAITLTVYYTISGVSDPSSFLIALKIDTTRTITTPEVYKLPRNNMAIVNDGQINRNGDDAKLYTSRYWQPSRNVQKTWRDFEFFLDCGSAPSAVQVPFQIWAVIDDALPGQVGPFQLLDANGAAADIVIGSGSSRQQVFFPTGTAVGSFIQLQFITPAASGGEVTGRYDLRDGILRGVLDPLTADRFNITLVLGDGEFEDRTSMRRTVKKQIADLKALTGRNTTPVAYKDINGNTGYLKIESLKIREIQFKEFQTPVSVAQIVATELKFA